MVGGTLRMDKAEDEGILFCADGESASNASPKSGSSVRCRLAREVIRFDMEGRNLHHVCLLCTNSCVCLLLLKWKAIGFRQLSGYIIYISMYILMLLIT